METVHISHKNPEAYVNAILRPNTPTQKILTGRVYSENGCPLSNACVKITDRHYNPLQHTITDTKGCYSITYPNKGYYSIFSKENYGTQLLSIDDIPEIVTLKYEDINSIVTGRVMLNTRIKPPDFLAVLELTSPDFSQSTTTTENGEFIFSNVPSGNYNLNIRGNNILTYNNVIFIPPSTKIMPIGLIYLEFIDIHGTLNGIITNTEGLGLVDVTVVLYKEGVPINCTKTIENGVYFFGNLAEGNYSIQAFN